jgi:hypothetical protein
MRAENRFPLFLIPLQPYAVRSSATRTGTGGCE